MTSENQTTLKEARIIIVGEGGAGKTSLAKKIVNPDCGLIIDEIITEGIDVTKWQFELKHNDEFSASIWDFGGQEIYHATHQLFFAKNALYILVADSRREDTDFEYWLNIVSLLGDDSPLIIVKNEKQDRQRQIDERMLRSRFDNLTDVMAVNLATNRGLDTLIEKIKQHVANLPHVGNKLPQSWVTVRQTLEADSRNYIHFNEFRNMCISAGLNEYDSLIEYLHDLGVCLYFGHDPVLSDLIILKPSWATEAFYSILDNQQVLANNGRITEKEIDNIWQDEQYKNLKSELLQLMMRFRLCFKVPNKKSEYIAPQLLEHTQPLYEWNQSDNLQIRYKYDFMPKSIVSQFIVEMNSFIYDNLVWRTGVVVETEGAYGEILEFYTDRQIRIRLYGYNKESLLRLVTQKFEKIHLRFSGLATSQLIQCSCATCKKSDDPYFFSFELLKKAIEQSRTIQCGQSFEMIDPVELLAPLVGGGVMSNVQLQAALQFSTSIATTNMVIVSEQFDTLTELLEAKIIIVGEPGAGKTSLMKKMINNNYMVPNIEDPTIGINIENGWRLPIADTPKVELLANIWDFGGHQIQYLIHQFFLTSNSLYVLVADDREQRTEFDYWFNTIYRLGEGSPVLVVLNEKRYKSITNFDLARYQEVYNDRLIIEKRDVNLAENDGRIQSLLSKISSMVISLTEKFEKIPNQWLAVRKSLEKFRSQNYITVDQFFEICFEQGIQNDSECLILSNYLHNLGSILHYQDDSSLADLIILNPDWIAHAIYEILSDKSLLYSGGIFNKDWLFGKWSKLGYTFTERNKLLSLMQKDNLELCYRIPQSYPEKYIVPQLLPPTQPEYSWNKDKNLQFRFKYAFMPIGIISRLIVRLHSFILRDEDGKDMVWKNGALFMMEDQSSVQSPRYALVLEEITKQDGLKIIHIRVSGNGTNKKELLTIIREEVRKIHSRLLVEVVCNEMIPCNCKKCSETHEPFYFDFNVLRECIEDGDKIQCHASRKLLNPLHLIDDVLGKEKFIQEEVAKGGIMVHGNIDKFVYQDSQTATTNFEEINVKKEKSIEIGNNNTISAPLVIADSIENSFNALSSETNDDKVQQLLKKLLESINEVAKQIPSDQDEEVATLARDAETLVREATSQNPRRQWYEVSIEGLKQAAINIGSVATPVLDIVKQLTAVLLV